MVRKERMPETMDEDFCNNNSNSTTGSEDIKNVDPLMNKVKVYKVYSPLLRQILSALGPILATISAGMTTGFSAVFLPQLQQNTSSIQITMEESSWIASITAFGMAPGCLLGGLIMQKYGRKFAHYFLCIPTVLGWISIMFATNVPLILVGRLFTGMAVGLLGPCSSVFIGESSEPKYRGFLLASITFSISLGMLCGHLLGTFLFWKDVAVVCSIFPVTICIALSFVPESPFWLLSQDRIEDAKEAFRWLRGCSPEAMEEIENLVSKHNVTKKEERALEVNAFGILKINLKKPEFVKPLGIILFFFMVMQFSGVNTVAFYTIALMKDITTDNEYLSMFIIDIVRVVMSLIACILLKICYRRTLVIVSGLGTTISMISVSLFLWMNKSNPTELNSWGSMCFLIGYICFMSIGLFPLPWCLIGELFPLSTRSIGSGITSCFNFICFFIVVKSAPSFFLSLDVYGTFFIYGCVALAGTAVLYFLLPETKNKTLQQIEEEFKVK